MSFVIVNLTLFGLALSEGCVLAVVSLWSSACDKWRLSNILGFAIASLSFVARTARDCHRLIS